MSGLKASILWKWWKACWGCVTRYGDSEAPDNVDHEDVHHSDGLEAGPSAVVEQ